MEYVLMNWAPFASDAQRDALGARTPVVAILTEDVAWSALGHALARLQKRTDNDSIFHWLLYPLGSKQEARKCMGWEEVHHGLRANSHSCAIVANVYRRIFSVV